MSLKLFASRGCIFVGVDVAAKIAKLQGLHELQFEKYLDIRKLAKLRELGSDCNIKHLESEELALALMGSYFMKEKRKLACSNWDNRVLDMDQVEHVTVDAYASYMLGKTLVNEFLDARNPK
ncbi:hypothetical protein CRG98_003488 [Punica granatum]|nr:hypothetical protein CRG98_003488 [Punica granatum]